MATKKTLIATIAVLAAVAVALAAVTAGILISQQNITATGTIRAVDDGASGDSGGGGSGVSSTVNLEVFSDALATTKCSSIDWGTLSPGGSATSTVYIKNTGNAAATLSVEGTMWSPASADSVLTLSWNREGTVLAAGAIVTATLTLHAAADTGSLTSFSLNIVISGSS